jgi:hypothetical protein
MQSDDQSDLPAISIKTAQVQGLADILLGCSPRRPQRIAFPGQRFCDLRPGEFKHSAANDS